MSQALWSRYRALMPFTATFFMVDWFVCFSLGNRLLLRMDLLWLADVVHSM
jgi:hypothetical protein